MTVREILHLIDAIAPFETQAEFDNSGLLVGNPEEEVTDVLFALDVTGAVVDEALALGVQLIVTHHPLMFSPRKRLTEEDAEGRLLRKLIRYDLNLIAAHTNLDQARDGMNDILASLCGLTSVSGEGFLRYGDLPKPLYARDLSLAVGDALHTVVRLMGPEEAVVHRLGVCSGGGSDQWEQAAAQGCDAFLSGEIKHHHALAMAEKQMVALECGHYATEEPGLFALADALQNALNEVECKVRIYQSAVPAYAFPQ